MSLILDALRKMEEERKARRGQTVDIRPIVLSQRRASAPPARRGLVAGIAGLVLLAGGIGAGVYLSGSGPAAPPVPASVPVAPAPAVQPAQPPAAALPAPVRPTPLPAPASPAATPLPSTRPAVAEPVPPAGEAAELPLTISGIAWQEERALRRAVVNGSLVAEGAEVAGARVVEIRERSVRFARGGRTFDIGYANPFPR